MARTDITPPRFSTVMVLSVLLALPTVGDAYAAARKKKGFVTGITRTDQLPTRN